MALRGAVIAVLLVIELAIAREAIVAVQGGQSPAPFAHADAQTISGPRLVEGGPHHIFDSGAHPALTVDIGYADLTIVTGKASQIDVSVSPSVDFGIFRSTAPIMASADSGTVRITSTGGPDWSIGDDRMVTVLVPPETQVTVMNAGDIRASGLRAEASFKSIGRGSVTVEDYAAPALHVASSKGRIVLARIVAPRLDVSSDEGRVEGTALQVRDGSIESDARVSLGFAAGADSLVTAEAASGKITVSGFALGELVGPGRKGSDDDDDSSSQTVRVGAGSGRLDVHSSDGNITLIQES